MFAKLVFFTTNLYCLNGTWNDIGHSYPDFDITIHYLFKCVALHNALR